MSEPRCVKCANCSAPLVVPLGETEVDCEYCDSRLRLLPGQSELEVVRTREELKYRERVALQQERMRQQLQVEEAERWRQTAAKVAIAALPVIGRTAGRAIFSAALRRPGGGCVGCGCVAPLLLALAAAAAAFGLLGR
jgi:DNA-directed RNA polymerase subunit RPC12/RpoP